MAWERCPWLDILWLEGGSGYEFRTQDGLECEQVSKLVTDLVALVECGVWGVGEWDEGSGTYTGWSTPYM